jgi:hypothetical protein
MHSADTASSQRLPLRMVFFTAALAFLLASFPARNSDLWAHLAAGRHFVNSGFSFSAVPETFASSETHQGWLYDVLVYGVCSATGGLGLVFSKALVVVALALVLLSLSRAGPGPWVPLACTTLALLAIGIRLLLQPATLSYLLLALTLFVLHHRAKSKRSELPSFLPPWPLMALFAVWVNLDDWFIVGLGVVLLWWIGEAFDRRIAGESRWSALLRYSVAGIILAAVCLLNPGGLRSFALPSELRLLASFTAESGLAAWAGQSPFGA